MLRHRKCITVHANAIPAHILRRQVASEKCFFVKRQPRPLFRSAGMPCFFHADTFSSFSSSRGMVLRTTSIIDSSYNLSDFLPFLSVVIAWSTPKNGPLPPSSFLTDRCNNGCDGGE
jgi:hypothetical protein